MNEVFAEAVIQIEVYTIKESQVGLTIGLLLGREKIRLRMENGTTSRTAGTL